MATLSNPQHLRIGLLLIGLGLGATLLISQHPEHLRVPAWVAYAGLSAFSFSGLVLIAEALGARRLGGWLVPFVIAGLLVPGLWIALGPGPRKCSVSIGGLGGAASDWLCRAGFGMGSLLGLVMLALAIGQAVSAKSAKA